MAIQTSYVYQGIVCPQAYFRVVNYSGASSVAGFQLLVYYDAGVRSANLNNNLGNPISFTIRDEPAILNPDGTVKTPATSYYTDLFSDLALQAAGATPLRAAYRYLKAVVLVGGVDV